MAIGSVSVSRADRITDTKEAVARLREIRPALQARAFSKYFNAGSRVTTGPYEDLSKTVCGLASNGYHEIKVNWFELQYTDIHFDKKTPMSNG